MMLLASGCWTDTKAAAPSPPPRPAPPSAAVEPGVLDATFGWYEADEPGAAFHETTKVPHVDGLTFGWRLRLACDHADIPVVEDFTLPSGGEWANDPNLTVSPDGTRATLHSVLRCEGGWIDNIWAVSPGDPIGDWTIRVKPEGFPAHTFAVTFIVPPADMQTPKAGTP